jgi:hypothetical protein
MRRWQRKPLPGKLSRSAILRAEVQGDVDLVPGGDPYVLAPFGNAPMIGGTDGVLSFRENRKPKMTLGIGFRGLEMTAVGVLQSYTGISHGFAFEIQHLATDRAEPCGRRRSGATEG